ncbi:MAG: NADH-quinone oxidoreductase subunit J [Chloroflexi bacterium]|nr:NADH-quinone oxidoreductase subunit J [Chloroflexota bacterium]MDA1146196.1 NADH-quinone oxidoreductase subunit J [Chloroflexota bacterium]
MIDRLPLPAQFDRIIMAGGAVVALVLTPILVVLLALLVGDQISAAELVFWLAFTVIVAGALGTVLLSNIVHAALALVATLLGVAAIYLLLATEFIALVQILVYGGGVVILIIFGLMLTNAQADPVVTDGSQKPFAAIVGLLLASIFIAAAIDAEWGAETAAVIPFRDFGARLFKDFIVPVIIVGVLLDIALSGALVNARPPREDDATPEGEAAS